MLRTKYKYQEDIFDMEELPCNSEFNGLTRTPKASTNCQLSLPGGSAVKIFLPMQETQETRIQSLLFCDNLEGWDGVGGGKEVPDGEGMIPGDEWQKKTRQCKAIILQVKIILFFFF